MSMVLENVAAANDAATEAKAKRWKPSGKKVYKPRMATKVRWALEDSMERTVRAQHHMRNCLAWLIETHQFDIDDKARAHLGRLELELFGLALEVSEMERILTAAIAESKCGK